MKKGRASGPPVRRPSPRPDQAKRKTPRNIVLRPIKLPKMERIQDAE